MTTLRLPTGQVVTPPPARPRLMPVIDGTRDGWEVEVERAQERGRPFIVVREARS